MEFKLDPQTALDAPRICIQDGTPESNIVLEDGISEDVITDLRRRGHLIRGGALKGFSRSIFGRGQIIVRDRKSGALWGASDGRGDGCAVGY